MLATAVFDHLFIKSNISAMDMLVVVKFHKNIANRWLFMIQRKQWLTFSIHKVILTCLGGRFFRTWCIFAFCFFIHSFIIIQAARPINNTQKQRHKSTHKHKTQKAVTSYSAPVLHPGNQDAIFGPN